MIDLAGKTIAITGASSGIGRATAIECARAGMRVVLGARREDRLREAVAQIESLGGKASAVVMDASRMDECRAFVERAEAAFGGLYAVFANAGYGVEKTVMEMPVAEVRAMFETNFFGSLEVVRAGVERFVRAGSGHALMCSSCLSKIGVPYYAAYCATKAAQEHSCRALRLELRGTGVHVSSVHPIGTRTEFFDTAAGLSGGKRRVVPRTSERFMQPPERVARAVVRCLRRPRGEVWTSPLTRTLLGLATVFPGVADWGLRKTILKQIREQEAGRRFGKDL